MVRFSLHEDVILSTVNRTKMFHVKHLGTRAIMRQVPTPQA
jgi:hypothetical protein